MTSVHVVCFYDVWKNIVYMQQNDDQPNVKQNIHTWKFIKTDLVTT